MIDQLQWGVAHRNNTPTSNRSKGYMHAQQFMCAYMCVLVLLLFVRELVEYCIINMDGDDGDVCIDKLWLQVVLHCGAGECVC